MWREVPGSGGDPASGPTTVTIGTFDGVHGGHQALLRRARETGTDAHLVAVTFDPHPMAVLRPEQAPPMLTTLDRRVELLRRHGADSVRVLAFTAEMALWSPEEFIRRVLVEGLRAGVVVVGENFRFGAKASGTVVDLEASGSVAGFRTVAVTLAGDDVPFSSSLARRLIAAGDVASAATVLTRPPELDGTVTTGDRRGRDLGFPTANLAIDPSSALPADGVYATWAVLDGRRWPAATSVGANATFAGAELRVESYLLDAGDDLDLYDRAMRVEFVDRLRGMRRFDGASELTEQMRRDVGAARRTLARSSGGKSPEPL